MPLYEDLVRRAFEAQERAESLVRDSQRIQDLAQLLRDADAGKVMLVRCAWCDSFRIGDEWLHLDAIGRGQQRITSTLLAKASHGICENSPGSRAATIRGRAPTLKSQLASSTRAVHVP